MLPLTDGPAAQLRRTALAGHAEPRSSPPDDTMLQLRRAVRRQLLPLVGRRPRYRTSSLIAATPVKNSATAKRRPAGCMTKRPTFWHGFAVRHCWRCASSSI
jgi:hypothetical protein